MNNKLNFEGVINPNEFGGLLYNNLEVNAVKRILLNNKIFRYATGEKSECDIFEERIKICSILLMIFYCGKKQPPIRQEEILTFL